MGDMANPNILAFIFSEISAFIRTDGRTDKDIYSSDESSIPFYSTNNGYKKHIIILDSECNKSPDCSIVRDKNSFQFFRLVYHSL